MRKDVGRSTNGGLQEVGEVFLKGKLSEVCSVERIARWIGHWIRLACLVVWERKCQEGLKKVAKVSFWRDC